MKKLTIVILMIALVPLVSCKKMLDIDSTRVVGEQNMWNTLEDARAALFGVYALNRAAMSDNNRHTIYGDVRLADFDATIREDLKAVHNNQLNADFPLINDLCDWRRFYATINAANIYLERIHEVHEKDPRFIEQTYNLDIAQVKALRAFSYFYITRIWGDVPLILSSHDGTFENKPRDPQTKVLAQIEQDLLAAEPRLPYAYDGLDPEQTGLYYGKPFSSYGHGYLMTKQAVWGILAHMYAWKGDYLNTAVYAQKIIDKTGIVPAGSPLAGTFRNNIAVQSGYPTNPTYVTSVWRRAGTGPEQSVLWAVAHGEFATSGTIEELTAAEPLVPNRAIPAIYVPKDTLFSIYDEGYADNRFSVDPVTKYMLSEIGFFTGMDKPYPVFRKIFVPWETLNVGGTQIPVTTFGLYASPIVFTRFNDIGLLLAEAKAVLNDKAGAIALLNPVRSLHKLPNYDENVNGSLIDAIFKERRREFVGEGIRWFDIVRYKKLKNNDSEFQKLINDGGIYWPVARKLVNQNPLLTQYPHWQ